MQTAPEGGMSPESPALESDLLNLGEMNLENEIQIYPNPSNGVFVVESENANLSQVTITSTMGTQVYQSKKESIGNRLKIDLSEQPSGVYLIQVAIDGNSIFKRIVKN